MAISRFQIKSASDEVKKRGRTFECHEIGSWVSVGTEPDKDDRGVHFEGLKIECFSLDTGEQCPSNVFGQTCSHAWAAQRRRTINAKRRRTLAAKRESRAA